MSARTGQISLLYSLSTLEFSPSGPEEENGLAPFDGGSESSSRVKADWNCLLQMLAFSLESVLRIPFSLSDMISNASFLSNLINDQNLLIFSGLGVSGSEISFSNVDILETCFQ